MLSCGRDVQNLSLWLCSYVKNFELMLFCFLVKAGIGFPAPLLMVGAMSQEAQNLLEQEREKYMQYAYICIKML